MASFDVSEEQKLNALSLETSALVAQSADPADPAAGNSVIWVSDGTGTGGDGDVLMKVTDTGGTTKVATLVDFSAVT